METAVKSRTGRNSKWDNLRCVLILAVVAGHFVNQFTDDSLMMRTIALFIYTWHMPLFIFVAGLMTKKWDRTRPFKWTRPVYFVLIGYVLKFLIYGIKTAFMKNPNFFWLYDTGLPWYMFAMAAFTVLAWLLRDVKPMIVMACSVTLAFVAGYLFFIGSYLWLSRIIVFFPFYYLGYLTDPGMAAAVTRDKKLKILSAVLLILAAGICILKIRTIYPYFRLFTARNAYAFINVEGCSGWTRLMCGLISLILGAAVLCLAPEKPLGYATVIGQRTLQIYFWHRLILYVLMYSGLMGSLQDLLSETGFTLFCLLLAAGLTLLLAQPVFEKPLNMIRGLQGEVIKQMEAYSVKGHSASASTSS